LVHFFSFNVPPHEDKIFIPDLTFAKSEHPLPFLKSEIRILKYDFPGYLKIDFISGPKLPRLGATLVQVNYTVFFIFAYFKKNKITLLSIGLSSRGMAHFEGN
jgi:hypothetical protein